MDLGRAALGRSPAIELAPRSVRDPCSGASHGVLAPNAKLRAQVVPAGPGNDAGSCASVAPPPARTHHGPVRISWARLLKRVFTIDLEHCPNCGGEVKIIAAIVEAPVIERILTHLGLAARAPPAFTGAATSAAAGSLKSTRPRSGWGGTTRVGVAVLPCAHAGSLQSGSVPAPPRAPRSPSSGNNPDPSPNRATLTSATPPAARAQTQKGG